jgi:hypothetical protein
MNAPNRTSRRSEGSVFILTLLVMLVLTIVGLSLSLTTQTEQQLGNNEHTIQQAFYAADAGVGLSTARAIHINDQTGFNVVINHTNVGALNHANRLSVTAFQQLLPLPCNLCEVNQGQSYVNLNHGINVTADRIAWYGTDAPPPESRSLGRKTVGAMVEIQPWLPKGKELIFRTPSDEQNIEF